MDLSSVSALRPAARTRSISPENRTGEPGGGARATTGTGAEAARDLGPGWKISPSVDVGPGETYDLAVIDGSGTITHVWATTHSRPLAQPAAAGVLGRGRRAGHRGPLRRLLLRRVGPVRPGQLAADRRQSERRLQLLLADAVPYGSPTDRREPLRGHRADLLPGDLRAGRGGSGPGLPARPVAAQQPARRRGAARDHRAGAGDRPLRRHLSGLGLPRDRLVGRGRDQVLPGR